MTEDDPLAHLEAEARAVAASSERQLGELLARLSELDLSDVPVEGWAGFGRAPDAR